MRGSQKLLLLGGALLLAIGLGGGIWLATRRLPPATDAAVASDSAAPTAELSPGQGAAPPRAAPVRRNAPPPADLAEVDHAVAKRIREAEDEVRRDPAAAEAWGKLGMVHMAHDFREPADECFVQATLRNGDDPRWHYLRGMAMIRFQPDAALPHLTRAVELCRDEPLAPRLRLNELYLELDRLDEAEPLLRRVVADHPDSARGHLALARLELRRGRLDACLRELDLAAQEQAGVKPAHELRAEVFQRQGRKSEADQQRRLAAAAPSARWTDPFYDEALKLRTGLKLLLTRAERLYTQGRAAESLLVAETAVAEYPRSDWAWILRGRAQIRLRRLDEAEQSLGKALEISPNSTDAQFRMGVLEALRGRGREAIAWFQKVLAQKADHPVALYNLGKCWQQTGNADEAIKSYRKAIDCQTDYFDAHVALGELLYQQGRSDEARKVFERACTLRPGDAALRLRLEELTRSK